MASPIAPTRDESECDAVRKAFIERPVRPSFAELSKDFTIPMGTLGNWSSQEGWVAMRCAYWEKKAEEGDALSVIHEAATKINRPVLLAITNAVLLAIQNIAETFHSIDPTKQKSPGTRASIINTLTFALNNIASTCKSVGITGFPKELKELGASREGGWTPALQQQINLTIQNAVAPTKEPTTAAPVDVKSESVSTT